MNGSISVVIPAYNAERFIGETLRSVFEQTRLPDEVIVVDDGSSDRTEDLVRSFSGITYCKQSNGGTAAALNTGIQMANSKYLALLDHDDIWIPEKLERQIIELNQNKDISMVFTMIENFFSSWISTELKSKIETPTTPQVGIHKSSLFIKKEDFLKVGLFSTKSHTQELLDWFARAKEMGLKEMVIREVLVKRRIHGTNQTLLNKEMKSDFPKVLKAILDRRRSAEGRT